MEYLTSLADLIREVRKTCVELHRPEDGDGNWCLACRAYQRTFNAIRKLSLTVNWLRINPELKALQFSFSVGNAPLRFYKGKPADPPQRYLFRTPGEDVWRQMSFHFAGIPSPDTALRLAVDVTPNGEAASVTLVEIDEYGVAVGEYRIPFGAGVNVTPMKAPAIDLPPTVAKPRKAKKKVVPDAVAS